MTYRALNNQLITSISSNEPHRYVHLVKFEKPGINTELAYADRANPPSNAENYAYLTDGAFDVKFDDGSFNSRGIVNGVQNYVANKILSVGTVNETIEAKASTLNLTLAATALSARVTTFVEITSNTIISSSIDFVQQGFSEGDTLELTHANSADSNHELRVRIDSFQNDNKTIQFTPLNRSAVASTGSYTISFSSEEINALTASKVSTNYSSYLNREVFIYRAHLNPETGAIIGAPFLIFKGIITNGTVSDDPLKGSTISWSLTSHWGDFVQVVGRLTSDQAHRGLNTFGVIQPEALIREEYAGDLGFRHAEQAVNIIATYQAPELRYRTKKAGGLRGLIGGTNLVEYEVMVDKDVDLEFNLSAKYIPVVYGVQKIKGIPFFADGDVSDAQKVYVAQAISEGPIQSIMDIHVEGNPLICINKKDNEERFNNADAAIACFGRADAGDILLGELAVNKNGTEEEFMDDVIAAAQAIGKTNLFSGSNSSGNFNGFPFGSLFPVNNTSSSATGNAGVIHEHKFNIDSPLSANFIFHSGLGDQVADSLLATKGLSKTFKVQDLFYDDLPGAEYWGPQHRVLDTAYVSTEFTIQDGEFTIPDYEFIVKGKLIDCYNYDYSYRGIGDPDLFKLGETVTLYKSSDNTELGDVQIIDKWSFFTAEGNVDTRFRFSSNLQLEEVNGVTDIKSFYMQNSSSDIFYFAAYNVTPSEFLLSAETGEVVKITFQDKTVLNSTTHSSVSIISTDRFIRGEPYTEFEIRNLPPDLDDFSLGKNLIFEITSSSGAVRKFQTSYKNYVNTPGVSAKITFSLQEQALNNTLERMAQAFAVADSWKLYVSDVVKLNSTSDSTDDFYNASVLSITKFLGSGESSSKDFIIEDYIGSSKLAKLKAPATYLIDSSNSFSYEIFTSEEFLGQDPEPIFGITEDKRASINPAIQLLDYLTSKRYGKGLSLQKDIDLPSFLSVARTCEQRSDVTLIVYDSATQAQPGEVYRYPETGDLIFQGTVKSVGTISIKASEALERTGVTVGDNVTFTEITFTDVIGKLGKKWNSFDSFQQNQVVWYEGQCFIVPIASEGNISESTRDSLLVSNKVVDSVGGNTLNIYQVTSNPTPKNYKVSVDPGFGAYSRNPVIKRYSSISEEATSSGYSLYDSDDCKYWAYLGWDSLDQRYVTRHQTSQTVDTSQSVFNNINAMLNQFNGMLKYSNGKYSLSLKTKAPEDTFFENSFPVRDISEDEIIGKVQISDGGSKKKYNSVSATIVDPANKFSGRGITFINSDYLKEDRGVKKQANYNVPGIINYFNARMNVKQVLDESRFGLTAKFTLDQKGYLLLAGDIIRVTYSRFGWENKYFRINSLNFQANGLVQVVADEHNEEAYLIDHIESGRSADSLEGGNQGTFTVSIPLSPTAAPQPTSTNRSGYIELNWINGVGFNPDVHRTQIFRAATNLPLGDVADEAEKVAEVQTSSYIDNTDREVLSVDGVSQSTSYYYWVRHLYKKAANQSNFSKTGLLALGLGTALPITQTELENGVTLQDGGIKFENAPSGEPQIRAGLTEFDTGDPGFFLGYSSDAYKFQVGDPTGNNLQFDGQNLRIFGSEFSITDSQNVPPSIDGVTPSGSGILLKADGDAFFGNSSTDFIFFDQSEGVLNIGGDVIGTDNIQANAINADKIQANSITTEALQANSITANNIQANSITTEALQANSITANNIQANAVTTEALQANSITANNIQANAVTTEALQANSITANNIQANAITTEALQANAITAEKLAANSVTANNVSANSVVATLLTASSVTASDITTDSLSALSANMGDITAGTLKGGTIPDANTSPEGVETGAFLDLTQGKMVFGNASKHILFDGTDLILSGVTIDAQSVIDAAAAIKDVQEDGVSVATDIESLNFVDAITVTASNGTASIGLDYNIISTNVSLSDEDVQDIVGAMVSGNTESDISVTYDDNTGKLNFQNTAPDLPVLLQEGTNISISGTYPTFTISSAGLNTEELQDEVASFIQPGLGLSKTYDDEANTLTITNTAPDQVVVLTEGSNVSITSDYPSFTIAATTNEEEVQDIVSQLIVDGTGLVKTYSDENNTLTLTNSAPDQTVVLNNGTNINVTGTYPTFEINAVTNQEEVEDFVAGVISGGSGITVVYDDNNNQLTISNSSPNQQITLLEGDNVIITSEYPQFTINATTNEEEVEDIVGGLIAAGTGISSFYDDTANTLTITNSAPDQTVTISTTVGENITVGGTYPDFTLSTDALNEAGVKTVIRNTVLAGSDISAIYNEQTETLVINNTAPDQTVTLTGAGKTTVSGTYPNFTITSTGLSTEEIQDEVAAFIESGTGINIVYDDVNNDLTITNSAPDQVVALTGGTNIDVTGTYPNFTISTPVEPLSAEAVQDEVAGMFTQNVTHTDISVTYDDGAGKLTLVNSAPDQTVTLTEGSNVTITGDYPNFTIASTFTNTEYTTATSTTLGLVKIGYTEDGKNYPVELDVNDKMFVNVPWTDTVYSGWNIAASGTAGTSAITSGNTVTFTGSGATTVTRSVDNITISSSNTEYVTATNTALGLVKIGYTENAKNYPVELDVNDKMFVNVPWADTNNYINSATFDSGTGVVTFGYQGTPSDITVDLDGRYAQNSVGYDASFRTVTFANLEKSNLSADGQLGFDSSQGILVYRGSDTAATTVLDGFNISAGSGISISNLGAGGTASEKYEFSVSGLTVASFDASVILESGETFSDSDTVLMSAAAIDDLIISKNYTTSSGVADVGAGDGLTGGGTTAAVTLNVGQGDGISVTADAIAVDSTVVRTTGTQTIGGEKTFSSNVTVSGNLTVSGTTTIINTEQLDIADNIIKLNSNYTGSTPTESAGLEVERGTLNNALFQWKEANVGIAGNLDAGWSFGTHRVEATGFYGTFYGDASNLQNVTADGLEGLDTSDLPEDPSATVSSGTMYFTNERARNAIGAGDGLTKSVQADLGVLNIGEGDGITVNADDIQVDATVLRTTTTFSGDISGTYNNLSIAADFYDGRYYTKTISDGRYLRTDADSDFTGTIKGTSDGTNPVLIIDGAGQNIVRFLDDGASATGIDLIYRTTPNTLGFEKTTDGSKLWETDVDTGVTTFNYTPYVSTNKIWHEGNDGHESGLDADTLDGSEATDFVKKAESSTITGNLTLDNGDSTTLTVLGNDPGIATISARGDGQGTGRVFVGQSTTFGGGIEYNGDGTPAIATGATADRIVLYRVDAGNYHWTAQNPYNSNNWEFREDVTVNGLLTATQKSFTIDHPTKEGMKLRHGSLEGPENGVYVRGRLNGNNTIELPDYWKGLVHEDSITVNLTPIGKDACWIENIEENTVIVGGNLNCFYIIFAERKDVDRLVVEYESDKEKN